MTVIKADGVEALAIHQWPDEVGKPIDISNFACSERRREAYRHSPTKGCGQTG